MMKHFPILLVAALVLVLGGCRQNASRAEGPIPIIFETDMGNDVDDVLALDLIHKAQDAGQARLLMVGLNKSGLSSAEFIDIMDIWYGYPDVPIGFAFDGPQTNPRRNFNDTVCLCKKADGSPAFKRSLKDYSSLPEAHLLYRKILAGQPDGSVVIASVGFSTNLARLMETGPDTYSRLSGMELIRKKVRLLSVMAGDFAKPEHAEYNAALAEHRDDPCVFFAEPGWAFVPMTEDLIQLLTFPEVYVTDQQSLKPMQDYVGNADEAVVYIDVSKFWSSGYDSEALLKRIADETDYKQAEPLFVTGLSETYLIHK